MLMTETLTHMFLSVFGKTPRKGLSSAHTGMLQTRLEILAWLLLLNKVGRCFEASG